MFQKDKKKEVADEIFKEGLEEALENEGVTVEDQPQENSELDKKIEELQKQNADYLDKAQRLAAEFDNFRKRTQKEKASMYDDGIKDAMEKVLPVLDNMERALQATPQNNQDDNLYKGIVMIQKQLLDIFAQCNVVEIEALGQTFDPNLHSAIAHEENENHGANEVIFVMQKGYKYKDKIIRPSMVTVAN